MKRNASSRASWLGVSIFSSSTEIVQLGKEPLQLRKLITTKTNTPIAAITMSYLKLGTLCMGPQIVPPTLLAGTQRNFTSVIRKTNFRLHQFCTQKYLTISTSQSKPMLLVLGSVFFFFAALCDLTGFSLTFLRPPRCF